MFRIEANVFSTKGRREKNEDNFYLMGTTRALEDNDFESSFEGDSELFLSAVADGMGGEKAGEIASKIVVEGLSADDPLSSIKEIQAHLDEKMGSTLSCLYIKKDKGYIIHMGDSCVFRFRDKLVTKLTKDDTVAQRLVDEGILSEIQAETHFSKDELTNYLSGSLLEAKPMVKEIDIQENDSYLLCSDGFSKVMNMNEIDIDGSAKGLVLKAIDKGTKDNVTVVLVKVGVNSGI